MSKTLNQAVPDAASIDAEYDPERRAGPRQPFIDWYVLESALARSGLECRLDIPYGPSPAETLDIFPSAEPDSPLLLYIHGGYWRALSSKEFSFVAGGLVPLGITVAVMNYALCPQVTIADITRQSHTAVAWLASNARRFSADPGRIYAAGHSAGGQQVGMLLSGGGSAVSSGTAGGAAALAGGIAISGLFDLRPLRHSWLQPTLQLTEGACEEQSPLLHVPRQAPPLLLTVGGEESESLIGQSQKYHATWRAAGLRSTFHPQPGANHYTAIYGLGDPDNPLARTVAQFMA
jgi:arylformamidase